MCAGELIGGGPVDLNCAPREVSWVHLDGSENRARQLRAALSRAPDGQGKVLIIGDSTSPSRQQQFASQISGAVTVEAVELKDLIQFARDLDFGQPDALAKTVAFSGSVMRNVGSQDLLRRVGILERGTARREPSNVELAALKFKAAPNPASAINLLVEIGRDAGVSTHRPTVLRACIRALQSCDGSEGNSFHDAAVRIREQNRILGRPLPNRAVGSTLTLRGLEADVSVILEAAGLDARNLYVAMTRGSKRLVVCSETPTLVRRM